MSNHDVTTEQEFDDALARSDRYELLLFTAPTWCIPCRRFESHWERAKEELRLTFIKVDMGATPEDTGQHWATARFGVRGVPTLKLITTGEPIDLKSRSIVPLIKEIGSHV